MRTARNLVPVLLAFLLILGGCATTPLGKYNDINETFIATVTTAVDAKQAGVISQEDWDTYVLPAINSGNAVLDDMRVAADAGEDPTQFERLLVLIIQQIETFLPFDPATGG